MKPMIVYLTHDYDSPNYIDVWLDKPVRAVETLCNTGGYVWLDTLLSRHVGVYKAEIVKRVFGVVPDDAGQCVRIETAELPKGLN